VDDSWTKKRKRKENLLSNQLGRERGIGEMQGGAGRAYRGIGR
jgi:hypothetical protein